MEKKLLCILFIFSLFFLNPVDGFGQCTEGPTTSASVSISLQGSNQICSDETISINSTENLDGGTNPGYQWQVQIGSGSWNDISGEISANLTSYSGVQNNSKFRLKITFCEGFPEEDTYFSNTSSTITVNQVTTATASITSNKTLICSNENISFSASLTNQGGSPIYSWRINGTERGSSSTFSWNQFSDGDSVQLWMTSSKPCATDGDADANNVVESNTITISLKPAVPDSPSAFSGPQNVCPNTSAVTYSITPVDRATSYIWTLPSGWTGSSTSTSIDITSGAVGNNQIIKVRAVNECGESTDASRNVYVGPGKPATPSSISNPGLICEGDIITLSVTNDSSVSYTWSVPTGWNITTGQGTSQINVTAGNYGENGTISVYASNECLDSDLSSINLAINKPKPGQPGTISGDALVCSGVGNVYSISSVQYADSYEWILDGNPVNGVIGTSFTFNSTSVGNHNLEVIAKNECGTSTASTQTIYVDDGTPDATSITETNGEINFCPDATGIIFNVPVDEKIDTYNWQVPSGWNITAGAGTNQITATAGKLGNDGQIQFTGSSNDCGSVSASYNVFVKDPAPDVSGLSITGETEICSNSTGVIYEVPSVQYATDYNWTFPANWSLISGQNTNKITVNAGTDDGQVMVEVSNECSASPEVLTLDVITTDGPPAQPGAITSTQEFMANPLICPPLNGLTFSVPFVSSDITYDWILPYGFNIVDGEGTNSIMVNVTNSGNYNSTETIDVVAMNDCYSSAPTTSFQLIIDDYIITDLGEDQTVCTTQTQINIPGEIRFGNAKKFNPVFSAVNGNGQNVSGNISGTPTNTNNYPNTFTFNYNATATDISSGSVKVSVQVPKPATSGSDPDACGTGYAEMTIFFRPEPSATITTTTEICTDQAGEITFTATPNTTLTYKIGSGSNQTIQVGESGTATLTTATLNSDTTYSLVSIQYTQAPNCSKSITGNATIIVNPVPSVDISYADQCNSESAAATVSYSNEIGAWETGTFLATGDLETKINADGSFIPANIAPGTYTVTYTITGSGGCSDVPVTTDVTIYEKVILTTQPENTRVCEGSEAQFEVTATGEGLSYQWYKDSATSGNEVSNGTNSVLNLSGISTADAGDYIVVVSGTEPCSSVTSEAALLTVDPSISIESQPVSTTICEGETISLNVTASAGTYSGTDFSYQWYQGTPGTGTAISGANASSLPLNTVTPDVSGDYYVAITGPVGYTCSMATSEVATVDVRPAPTVEIGGNTTICEGESADVIFSAGTQNAVVTYTINGNNTNPQNISLDANGEAVLNTGNLFSTSNSDTDFVYEIQSVAYANDPTCTIAVSGSTTITVAPNPEVTISFADNQTEFCTADNTSYTPILEGTGTYSGGTFSSNGLTLNPATGALTPGNEVAGIYTITYTIPSYGGCPEETTSLDISIYEEVQITSQPSNLGICSTSDAEFTVTATGDNLTYQWFKVVGEPDINSGVTETDDSPVTGATSVLLSLPVATSEDGGAYYVKVGGTNACTPSEDSQVASEVVTLNIDEDIIIIEPAEDIRVCDETNASVVFKFVAHANGEPLTFEWIYADGTPVNPDGTHMVSNVESRTDYPGLENITVYEGTLIINEITSADQASYAVRIDGSGNDFNCPEAISNSFNLDVDPLPNAPTATSPIEYCLGETATELTVSGEAGATFTWYDSNGNEIRDTEGNPKVPTPETSTSGSQTYFVTQKDAYCESPQTEVVVTVFDPPSAPDLTDEEQDIIYCLGDTATALTLDLNGAVSANWYDSESSTTPLGEAPTPQTTAVGTINYWVSFVNDNGCESDKAIIAVHVSALPEIALPADQEICEGETFQITASDNNEISGIPTTYSWNWEGNTDDPLNGAQQDLNPVETTTYTVTATNGNGCINTAQITINVDPQPVAGTLDAPASVCVSDPNGELNLTDHVGTIARWEYKAASSSSWTAINEDTPDANYPFSGLNEATSYRVVLTNGVCEEVYSNEFTITVDPEPVAGQILFKGTDRIFMMCEFPTADYLVPLQTSGTYVGDIIAWQYRRSSATDWSVIKNTDGTNFTGTTLSGQQVNLASNNESTLFRIEVQSGACSPNVFSDNATLSIIPSDIAPNPVTITRESICLGETISLSSGTGYGGYGTFEGGAFDNSSIANHGWRVKRFDNDTEYTFQSAADNTRPERWMRTNPHDYIMANPNGSGTVYQRFDSSSGNEGNKGFAIVSGNNPSTLETPVFNTYTMDNPTLTFDQAYNLTPGDTIKVQISLDGGNTYVDEPIFVVGGVAVSGNYDRFGDDGLGEPNNMSIDLSQYAGLPNLRIRWLYDGSTGGIYTIDDIGVPQDPDNVQLIWYYDADPDNPDNALEQIGEINQSTVSFTPDKIGWNYFEVQTALVFDTNGDPCQSAENMATIRVYVFDSYTTTATANVGSCGSTEVPLKGILTGGVQGEISAFPPDDESTLAWSVISGPDGYNFSESHFTPSNSDPNATFTPPLEGPYTLSWKITPEEDNSCTIQNGEVTFNFAQCTTLDFDGDDDYVDLGTTYTGNHFIEAWIRPEATSGTIISGPGFEIKMENLPGTVTPNTRWYHIAVANNKDLWIDGIKQSTSNIAGTGGNRTLIGARWDTSNKEAENYFSGWIEEVRIWKKDLTEDQIRFMMNQHLQNAANMGVEIPMPVPGGLTYADLAGYYRLVSAEPDPLNIGAPWGVTFDPALMPTNGLTPNLANAAIPGRLYNMTTNQENTAPMPYISAKEDQLWETDDTWLRPAVWDAPNSNGIDGTTPIDWNIVRTNHNIDSGDRDITVLGLKSETAGKLLTITRSGDQENYTNPGQMLRVTHYLLLNGNIDLVGESQLLQDSGSILAEASVGYLERDQQGKRNSFVYNYWSSPVSAQGAANNAAYNVKSVLMDGTTASSPKTITFNPDYWAADGATTSNPITISTYWLWGYSPAEANIYAEWDHIRENGPLKTGEGFTMKGTNGSAGINEEQNYTFRGKPHNGDFDLSMAAGQNYLIGNPFPSAMDADEFIFDNLINVGNGRNNENVFDGALYFWDHFQELNHILKEYVGGYATYNLSGGVPAISNDERINANDAPGEKYPGQYIPVGQAFLINSSDVNAAGFTVTGGSIHFKNSQRIFKREKPVDDSQFLKPEVITKTNKEKSQDKSKIRISFKSPVGYHRQILVAAIPSTTNGFDLGYDAMLFDDNAEDMYWLQGDNQLVIQGVPNFDKDQVLPLGVKIKENKEFRIKIDTVENAPEGMMVYLNDKLNDSIHDLRKAAYVSTSEPGFIHDRFEIIFYKDEPLPPVTEVPGEDPIEIKEEFGISIRHGQNYRELQILNPHELSITNMYIFDLNGNKLEGHSNLPGGKEFKMPVRNYSSGVYIVQIVVEGRVVSKKIIISN